MQDNEQLQDLLAQLRRKSPPLPPLVRQKLLSQLLMYIQHSPRLWQDDHQDYAYALNTTLEWVCMNVGEFSPEKAKQSPEDKLVMLSEALMRWVNGHLKNRIRDLKSSRLPSIKYGRDDRPDRDYRLLLRAGFRSVELDKPIGNDLSNQTRQGVITTDPRLGDATLLDDWIEKLQQNQRHRIGIKIRQYVETDPDNLLQSCSLRQLSDCHCQMLTLRMHFAEPPETRRQIAAQFGVAEQALYSHWRTKCLPLVQIIALRHDTQVRDYVRQDPEDRLRNCRANDLKDCDCLDLAQQLLLSEVPKTLKVLAKQLSVNQSTLLDHWQTQCLPLLKAARM